MTLRVVVDANIVTSALVRPGGFTASELQRNDVEWLAPAFILDEMRDHAAEFAVKAGCTRREWDKRVAALVRRIRLIPEDELVSAAGNPLVALVAGIDPDDAAYAAAMVVSGADFLWTRDRAVIKGLAGRAVLIVPSGT